MTKSILLACASGMSTGMLVERMKEAAQKKNVEVVIDAVAESSVKDYLPVDIIMLGPQAGHLQEEVQSEVGKNVPVTTIDMVDYGMMNGEKVLNEAMKIIEKGE